jgi:hypothetical protein
MSGMLQHNDVYRERAMDRQEEARRWAEVDHLARLSRANRPERVKHPHHHRHHHTVRLWLRAWRMHLHGMGWPLRLGSHH